MITIILLAILIGFILAVIWCVKQLKCKYRDTLDIVFQLIFTAILGATVGGLFIWDMTLVTDITTANVIDSQIAIVEEENTELEEQICSAVENYLKHEGDIFQSLDITTAIGLYSAYPNLKSNELVQSLIETYQANTSEIKALKMKKTEISKYKWLVYFGH